MYDEFVENGIHHMDPFLDLKKCKNLVNDVYKNRSAETIFIDKNEYSGKIGLKNANPQSGVNNFAEEFDLSFIEEHPEFKKTMTTILGSNYSIMLKKFIFAIPTTWLPDWIKQEIKGAPVANLAAFIKPELRNITYFHGIDFHQDIIDWKSRVADFITLYVYLEDVDMEMSPLVVVPRSHIYGATIFPHKISILSSKQLKYADDRGNSDVFNYEFTLGKTGSVNFWSAMTLHGTQPTKTITHKPRISLRYLIKRDPTQNNVVLDEFTKTIRGSLSLNETRNHLDKNGKAVKSGNTINKIN